MTTSTKKIRLATASPGTQASTPETLAQLAEIARRAASLSVDILLLPEAYIGGYPRGSTFGCSIGGRTPEGRDEYLRYFASAVDLGDTVGDGGAGAGRAWVRRELDVGADGSGHAGGKDGDDGPRRGDGTREELERIARDTGVFVVTGCIEKAGGSLYCAVVYVCPVLGVIGKRRKVLPTATERLIWAQGSPATLRAVSTTIRGVRVNLAAAICWENYMPLLRQSLYAQNINLWLAPTADARDAWLSLMRTVGIEGRCFVVSSNMCVPRGADSASVATAAAAAAAPGRGRIQEKEPGEARGGVGGEGGATASQTARRRRSSCVTEEGFEIALPPSPTRARRRRKSVFDEEGNEIVLPCDVPIPEENGKQQPPQQQNGVKEDHAHQPAKPAEVAAIAPTEDGDTAFVSRGGSCIVSPFGDVLAGPQWGDSEGIIYADVDFDDCIRGRLDLDAAGSYSRNDSFKLSVQGLDMSPLSY